MEFDFSKLRGRIVERFGTCAKFADAMGHSNSWLSARLTNTTAWASNEIHIACKPELLDIPADEIGLYFFTPVFRFSELTGRGA